MRWSIVRDIYPAVQRAVTKCPDFIAPHRVGEPHGSVHLFCPFVPFVPDKCPIKLPYILMICYCVINFISDIKSLCLIICRVIPFQMPLVGGHGFSKTARLSPSQAVGADVIRHSQYFYPVRPAGRGYYFAVGCEWYFYIRPGETAVKIIRPAF